MVGMMVGKIREFLEAYLKSRDSGLDQIPALTHSYYRKYSADSDTGVPCQEGGAVYILVFTLILTFP